MRRGRGEKRKRGGRKNDGRVPCGGGGGGGENGRGPSFAILSNDRHRLERRESR